MWNSRSCGCVCLDLVGYKGLLCRGNIPFKPHPVRQNKRETSYVYQSQNSTQFISNFPHRTSGDTVHLLESSLKLTIKKSFFIWATTTANTVNVNTSRAMYQSFSTVSSLTSQWCVKVSQH